MTFPKLNVSALLTPTFGRLRKFDEELVKFLEQLMTNLSNIFGKAVSLTDNLDCEFIDYTSNGVADTEDTVAHTLRRVPTGFIVVNRDKAGAVYDSGTAWTTTNIYLKCSAVSTAVKLIVF